MKNTYKGIALFLGCSVLLLTACQQKPKEEKPSDEPEVETRDTVKPPEGIISIGESKSLYDNYSQNRVRPIMAYEMETNDDEEFVAARYVDISYDEMKQYMDFVDQEAKKAKVKVSTYRLYFANYPNAEKFPDGKKVVHPRQNSIFILPTLNQDGQNYGFYIGANGEAQLIKNAVKSDANGYGANSKKFEKSYASFAPFFSAPPALQGDQSLIMNHGNSGPPPPGDF